MRGVFFFMGEICLFFEDLGEFSFILFGGSGLGFRLFFLDFCNNVYILLIFCFLEGNFVYV